MLRQHAHLADVIYTRWRDGGGREFPYSPYDRVVHIAGANFVGTDVLINDLALASTVVHSWDRPRDVQEDLRRLAAAGFTFHGVDRVTYTRG